MTFFAMYQKRLLVKSGILHLLTLGMLTSTFGSSVLAQVRPDNSPGQERSTVTTNVNVKGTSSDVIEGGAIRGRNLFHNFEDFNVRDEFPQKLHKDLCELEIKSGNVTLENFEGPPSDIPILHSISNRSKAKKCGCWANCSALPSCGKNGNGCFQCR